MNSQIIIQHIDVMVLGPKKFNFLQLILQKTFQYSEQTTSVQNQSSSNRSQTSNYIKILKKFLSYSNISSQSTNNSQSIKSSTQLHSSSKQLPNQKQNQHEYLQLESMSTPSKFKTFCGIHKFSKMIETQTFWLTINFYVTDMKIYDPILSQYTRGAIPIGIIISDDQIGSLDLLKSYLSAGNVNTYENIKQPQKNTRGQNMIQAKINSRVHAPCVNGFNSLLCLRLRDQHRLVEESNNLRLTNNQIFRWIVDRYFQNKYKVKLRESLGDEIERGSIKKEQQKASSCEMF